ncbi:MAG: hypothetical protein PHF84_03590 [bacterium]|nr:hypothetical protein [bacterium]
MKRSRIYRKGKHIYIKSGPLKEVHLIDKPKEPEHEYDEHYEEIYTDQFRFETGPKGITIHFGKQIFGTDLVKLKKAIHLDIRTARQFLKILEQAVKSKTE